MSQARKLVIVESPTKARKIQSYLGDDYEVEASVGHIRDLPQPKDLPAEMKKGPYGKFSVDVDNGFDPYYVVHADKKKKVSELKKALKDADELFLATDEDREGEAIAWHLIQELKPKVPVKRMVFHEITRDAILRALENTRELDQDLVDAQETRRILDRLYGYEVSPVLWRKVRQGLSAGRVQSVATRLVVERERERMAFVSADYWDVAGTFGVSTTAVPPPASPPSAPGSPSSRATRSPRAATSTTGGGSRSAPASAARRGDGERRRRRAPVRRLLRPQPGDQAVHAPSRGAVHHLHHAAGGGPQAADVVAPGDAYRAGPVRERLHHLYAYRQPVAVVRGHERRAPPGGRAVRPRVRAGRAPAVRQQVEGRPGGARGDPPRGRLVPHPGAGRRRASGDQFRLYELIWKRTVASQMADAKGSTASVRLGAVVVGGEQDGNEAVFSASGTVISFRGFLAAYEESADADTEAAEGAAAAKETRLPTMSEGDALVGTDLAADGHSTAPPARYTEASLVKALEERGIGRPSTYAATISTIQDRGYVITRGQALVPTWLAFAVIRLLEEHFDRLVDYDFTATMEEDLDQIAAGSRERVAWLKEFYFGEAPGNLGTSDALGVDSDGGGLRALVANLGEIDAAAINSVDIGEGIRVRVGRYGPYIEDLAAEVEEGKTPPRASVPDDVAPDELTIAKARELLAAGADDGRVLGTHPESGNPVIAKNGRYGPYVTEQMPEPDLDPDLSAAAKKRALAALPKPRTASLLKTQALDSVTLEDALQLMSLPRVVGVDPESGDEITAQNGRYGPYLKKGTDSRTLPSEEAMFTVTLEEALEIYKQPKRGRGRTATPPLRELGDDPNSGKPIQVKDGRFGPYVTDGETNRTLPRDVTPESITAEQAIELLAEKRAQGPAKKRTTRSTAAKKPAAKKAPAKKAPAKKASTSK